ncbi:probable pectinesterase 29 [Rosa rugosa]|uniref:probable pectinesterase 29 n=1 Tax=Rosa rugosa TaxID=74645 RepID=UPI002B408670|nr:probable pectinesterase 29 [Rosa rugosa]
MSFLLPWLAYYSFVAILLGIGLLGQLGVDGQVYKLYGQKKLATYTITVDQSGQGNFTKIQSAIDAVPSNNKHWVCIKISAGTYREKVKIPFDKPYILLKGENKRQTQIVWDDIGPVDKSATFTSEAPSITVKSITFANSYNNPFNSNRQITQALAAMISGDKTSFYKCGFFGFQDTLWAVEGRHFYKHCTIQGAIDFIFGHAQAIFQGCSISVVAGNLQPGGIGYITAQGREQPNEPGAFIFKNCRVHGTGLTYLGRAWRLYSRVIFYDSNLSDIVVPQGWDGWQALGHEDQLTFAEYGCYGPGADTSKRVSWEKKLSPNIVQQFTSLNFIDSDGWLIDQPF